MIASNAMIDERHAIGLMQRVATGPRAVKQAARPRYVRHGILCPVVLRRGSTRIIAGFADEADHEAADETGNAVRMQITPNVSSTFLRNAICPTLLSVNPGESTAPKNPTASRTVAIDVTGRRRDGDEARDHAVDHRYGVRFFGRDHIEHEPDEQRHRP